MKISQWPVTHLSPLHWLARTVAVQTAARRWLPVNNVARGVVKNGPPNDQKPSDKAKQGKHVFGATLGTGIVPGSV